MQSHPTHPIRTTNKIMVPANRHEHTNPDRMPKAILSPRSKRSQRRRKNLAVITAADRREELAPHHLKYAVPEQAWRFWVHKNRSDRAACGARLAVGQASSEAGGGIRVAGVRYCGEDLALALAGLIDIKRHPVRQQINDWLEALSVDILIVLMPKPAFEGRGAHANARKSTSYADEQMYFSFLHGKRKPMS